MTRSTIDVQPFLDWCDHRIDRLGSQEALLREIGWDEETGARRLHRWRHENVDNQVDRALIEDAIHVAGALWHDVYDDLDDDDLEVEPEPLRLLVDARGRSLVNRRGVPARLTDDQVITAHRLHIEHGMSLRELGRRGWRAWGYSSPKSAAQALSSAFKRLAVPARDRVEATVLAHTVHGLSTRDGRTGNPESLEHRRELRRRSGEVRGVQCAAMKVRYGKGRGERCQRPAGRDSDFCRYHDPALRGEVEAVCERARAAAA